ncbi:MAG: NADPH:quinone oxidoreductase family protein [bacterium]|nr:NADPH:quinone oxidoreductase family protein [Gammaproteobacteria bacterium]HIL95490.1 NADPH:quinone oxidoreductase family protein [Pseudomonadales bacterium]
MRAIVCEAYDSPVKLAVSTVDQPDPKPSEVLVAIKATGLGYVDALTVAGLYQIKPKLPFIPGNEISGVVEQVGADVKNLQAGQRILAMPSYGGLAEKVCINAEKCIPIPDALSHEGAAGFQVNYCTAYHGLTYCGNLQADETVLILGAAGGVGVAAIDVAKALGGIVIAAASTPEKREACIKLGADHVVDYSQENWRDELRQVLDGRPLDVVYDPVGGNFAEPALRSLGPDGRFLVVGFADGEIPRIPINLVLLKRCRIIGVNWGGFSAANPSEARPTLDRLLDWISAGKLDPQAGERFPLEESGIAMMKMLDRKAVGKIVIAMDK